MHVSRKWTFCTLELSLCKIFGQIVSLRVKKPNNTNMVALRHMKWEKCSLPVDVRRSKTSLLKNRISLSTPQVPDIIVHLYHLVIGCTNLPSIHYLLSYNEKALFCANVLTNHVISFYSETWFVYLIMGANGVFQGVFWVTMLPILKRTST